MNSSDDTAVEKWRVCINRCCEAGVISGISHWPHMDKLGEFNQILDEFLGTANETNRVKRSGAQHRGVLTFTHDTKKGPYAFQGIRAD